MKTHGFTTLTGAIKNTFGTVVGKYKAESHFRYPKKEDFNTALIDIFSHVRPGLNIMDAIVAMEGNGPTAGRLRNAGLILASPDAVSLDAVFAGLIGVSYQEIDMISQAAQMGFGTADISQIEVLGCQIKDCRLDNFILPEASFIYSAPHWIIRIFGNLIRSYPFIDKAVCVGCRICEKNCPAIAIDIDKYRIDYSKCIYCFCCSELCPKNAVGSRKSLTGNLLNLLIKLRFKWLSRRLNGKITA
jgi:ferredoxin